jgi:hypothetical protein
MFWVRGHWEITTGGEHDGGDLSAGINRLPGRGREFRAGVVESERGAPGALMAFT